MAALPIRAEIACEYRALSDIEIVSEEAAIHANGTPDEKGGAGAPPLSGADWLLVNRQTTISEAGRITADRPPSSGRRYGPTTIHISTLQPWPG